MNIRPAFSDDCPALAAIDTVSNPSPWSVKQFASALAQSTDKLWVCETDGVIGGFIVWQDILDESELHLIATAPEYRRQGIAVALLEHWLRHAQTAGITRLLLEVRAGNAAAQSLYLKYGFTAVGIRKHYYSLPEGGHEDAVLMEKPC